jgi:hypothetical protein
VCVNGGNDEGICGLPFVKCSDEVVEEFGVKERTEFGVKERTEIGT